MGLYGEVTKLALGEFLNTAAFNSTQIRFINQIIDYLTQNGIMAPAHLYEQPFIHYIRQV